MDTDFQSLSKGVFVLPFREQDTSTSTVPTSGPSRLSIPSISSIPSTPQDIPAPTRPLKKHYDTAYSRYARAYEIYEDDRVSEQVDEIAEWLREAEGSGSGWIELVDETFRVPVGVLQNAAPTLSERLQGGVARHVVMIHGKDVPDLAAGVRGIAVGLAGEAAATRRSGRSGMDEVDLWFSQLRPAERLPVIIHITSAQVVPPSTLSELIYILTIHPAVPIRLLLSVPSTSTFLASLTLVEPSSVDLSVLESGRRKRGGAVRAVLRADEEVDVGLKLGEGLKEWLSDEEERFAGGALGLLKAIKWALLHHSVNSPLASLALRDQAAAERLLSTARDELKEEEQRLLDVGLADELISTLYPAPRTSVLHALDNVAVYAARAAAPVESTLPLPAISHDQPTPEAEAEATPTRKRGKAVNGSTPTSGKRKRGKKDSVESPVKHSQDASLTVPVPLDPTIRVMSTGPLAERGDLRELQVMFKLYRGAGRTINLWDWLEGFRGGMHPDVKVIKGNSEGGDNGHAEDGQKSLIGRENTNGNGEKGNGYEDENENNDEDDESASRLHAAFVRFCEEARMMGLVRAKGSARGRRVDEVVKSVGFL